MLYPIRNCCSSKNYKLTLVELPAERLLCVPTDQQRAGFGRDRTGLADCLQSEAGAMEDLAGHRDTVGVDHR